MENKEVAVIEKKVTRMLSTIEDMKVVDDKTMNDAGELRKEIKDIGKELKNTKDGILKPLKSSIDNIKALFAPAEMKYERAEGLLTNLILSYQNDQEKKRRQIQDTENKKIEEARLLAEKGKISEKKLEKIEEKAEAKIEQAPEVVRKTDTFHTRTIKKVRIVNEKLIPRDFLMPDTVKINTAVKGGLNIPGCELYEENTLI